MKTQTTKQAAKETTNVEESELAGDDNQWLAAMQEALSPYWSARVEYQKDAKSPILVVNGLAEKSRRAA